MYIYLTACCLRGLARINLEAALYFYNDFINTLNSFITLNRAGYYFAVIGSYISSSNSRLDKYQIILIKKILYVCCITRILPLKWLNKLILKCESKEEFSDINNFSVSTVCIKICICHY